MQTEGALAIGTQVSAKYKGAFCEAKVRSVEKLVKVKVMFKHGLGSTTVNDKDIITEKVLVVGANVQAKHPDKLEFLDAVVKEIKDQSRYTVTFNDGDIATLRRNALCMKSGKHYSASESLDNLPLTHPEHFSTPVSGPRKKGSKQASGNESDDYESSSDGEDVPSFYLTNVGRVVWAENTDKKSKIKDAWFPALIVAPSASDTVKIDTKGEFLIRSFKDGRYYTVSKKDTKKFHKDLAKRPDRENMKEAVEKAVAYLECDKLPPHWDRDILFNMDDDSMTESSESEELDDEEDSESPEEKDHLVAELYKHMEDRGQPINKNPTIDGREVDLYRLFKVVYKAGGQARVTNKNMWQQVAKKLGFETAWCVNQVRVHYNRYLKSFEQLNRTLGCTMKMTTPTGGGRTQIRGIHRSGGSGTSKEAGSSSLFSSSTPPPNMEELFLPGEHEKYDEKSDESFSASIKETKNPVVSQSPEPPEEVPEEKEVVPEEKVEEIEPESFAEPIIPAPVQPTPRKVGRPKLNKTVGSAKKDTMTPVKSKKDSSSSTTTNPGDELTNMEVTSEKVPKKRLIQALIDDDVIKEEDVSDICIVLHNSPNAIEKQENIDETVIREFDIQKEYTESTEEEIPKLQLQSDEDQTMGKSLTSYSSSTVSSNKDPDEPSQEKRGRKKAKIARRDPAENAHLDCMPEDQQYLSDKVDINVGDKIKVFYKRDTIYDAKVVKVQQKEGEKWPKFYVHYQGWNARYDEWIKRSRIAAKLSGSKEKSKKSGTQEQGESEDESDLAKKRLEVAAKSLKKLGKVQGKTPPSVAKVGRPRSFTPTSSGKVSNAGSPGGRRQFVRSASLRKDGESEQDDQGDDTRKSSRITKPPLPPGKRRKGRPRKNEEVANSVGGESNDEGDADDEDKSSSVFSVEVPVKKKRGRKPNSEKIVQKENKVTEGTKNVRGRKRKFAALSKEEDEDPYAFKESGEDGGVPSKSPGRPGRKPKLQTKPEPEMDSSSDEDEENSRKPKRLSMRGRSRLTKNDPSSNSGSSDTELKKNDDDIKVESSRSDDEVTGELQAESAATLQTDVKVHKTKAYENERDSDSSSELKIDEPTILVEDEFQPENQSVVEACKESKDAIPSITTSRTSSPSVSKAVPTAKSASITTSKTASEAKLSVNASITKPKEEPSDAIPVQEVKQTHVDLCETPQKSIAQVPKSNVECGHSQRTDSAQSSKPPNPSLQSKSTQPIKSSSSTSEPKKFEALVEETKPSSSDSSSLPIVKSVLMSPQPSASKKFRKPPKKPNSSELVESDSDSGNEHNKASSIPSQASKVSEEISDRTLSKHHLEKQKIISADCHEEDSPDTKPPTSLKNIPTKRALKKGTQEEENPDLLCTEIIPGSPVHPSSSQTASSTTPKKPDSLMPFLSRSSSSEPTARMNLESEDVKGSNVMKEASRGTDTTDDEEVAGPSHLLSTQLQSSKDFKHDGSKSPTESSEFDLDGPGGQQKTDGSEVESERRGPTSSRKRPPPSPAGNQSPHHSKRRRRARDAPSTSVNTRGSRAEFFKAHNSDPSNEDHHKAETDPNSLISLENDELLALTQKPTKKYNFFVQFDPAMKSSQRVLLIQNSIKELQKTYKNLKNSLALIERRRKKIRRKERCQARRGLSGNSADGSS